MVLQNGINANATTPLIATQGGSGVSNPTAHGILVTEGTSVFNPIILTNSLYEGQELHSNFFHPPVTE